MGNGKYETHVLPQMDNIAQWAGEGATVEELANRLGVGYPTLLRYLDEGQRGNPRYRDFARAVSQRDRQVEDALFIRARGMEYEEVKTAESRNRSTGEIEKLVTTTKKYLPPNPTLAMFWLMNRQPRRWKKGSEAEEPDEDEGGIIVIPEIEE